MIRFSEEQAMLLDTAREFCQKRAPIGAVRQAIQAGQPLDATLWQTMPKHKQIPRSPVLTSKLLASVQRRLQQSFLASSCSQSVPPQRV